MTVNIELFSTRLRGRLVPRLQDPGGMLWGKDDQEYKSRKQTGKKEDKRPSHVVDEGTAGQKLDRRVSIKHDSFPKKFKSSGSSERRKIFVH